MTITEKARNRYLKIMRDCDLYEDIEESTGRRKEDMDIPFMIQDCITMHEFFAQSDLEPKERRELCGKLSRFVERFKDSDN